MFCEKLVVRSSKSADMDEIAALHRDGYGRENEADIALMMLYSDTPTLSLVADCDSGVIGHILLTEIQAPVKAMMLSPLAVNGKFRELQVGSTLVRHALKSAAKRKFEAIFVPGDPLFYERFGFSSASADAFSVKWKGPRFLAVELKDNALSSKKGKIEVPEAFSGL
ncbi:MAG: N-acetyltransferase [Pseudomonadota bacterium]